MNARDIKNMAFIASSTVCHTLFSNFAELLFPRWLCDDHLRVAFKSHSKKRVPSILDGTSVHASLSVADPHICGIIPHAPRAASRGTARASIRARQHNYTEHIVFEIWSDDSCIYCRSSVMEPCEVQKYSGVYLWGLIQSLRTTDVVLE